MEENKQVVDSANAPAAKVKKPIYKKWWFWVIIVVVVIGILGSFGGSEESSESPKSDTTQSLEASQATENPNAIGDYECKVLSATLCKDYEGKDAVKIKYQFTNNAQEPTSFDIALIDEVYQDGVQLETAILGIDDDVDYGFDVKIKNGVTKEVTKVYVLRDKTTPLDVEISELISLSDDKLATRVELQ